MTLAPGASVEDLLAALPGDLLLLQLAGRWCADLPTYVRGGAVAMHHAFGDEPEVVVAGDPDDAYDLALSIGADRAISVPRPTGDRLVAENGWAERAGWAFRATRVAPGLPVDGASWLDLGDAAEVRDVLDAGFPDASMRVGDPGVRRWAGVHRDGRLVAVAADATLTESLGFLASIASHPDVRGTGAGAAVTAWATAELVRARGACGLWHMAGNHVASGLYARLGYSDDHRMAVVGPP